MLEYAEKVLVLRGLFKLFMESFETSNREMMAEVAALCKKLIDSLVSDHTVSSLPYNICDAILDVVCFVYEESHMFDDQAYILKLLADSEHAEKPIKIRALEELLSFNLERQARIEKDRERYERLLAELKGSA